VEAMEEGDGNKSSLFRILVDFDFLHYYTTCKGITKHSFPVISPHPSLKKEGNLFAFWHFIHSTLKRGICLLFSILSASYLPLF